MLMCGWWVPQTHWHYYPFTQVEGHEGHGDRSTTTAKQVHQFLGLVCYISAFLPALAEHTSVLTPLMKKECNVNFPPWDSQHQHEFEAIKGLVLSCDCLTSIDHHSLANNKIFVTCNASHHCTAILWRDVGDGETSGIWKLAAERRRTALPGTWTGDVEHHVSDHKVACRPTQYAYPHLYRSQNSPEFRLTKGPIPATSTMDGVYLTVWTHNHIHQGQRQHSSRCALMATHLQQWSPPHLSNLHHWKWPHTLHKN